MPIKWSVSMGQTPKMFWPCKILFSQGARHPNPLRHEASMANSVNLYGELREAYLKKRANDQPPTRPKNNHQTSYHSCKHTLQTSSNTPSPPPQQKKKTNRPKRIQPSTPPPQRPLQSHRTHPPSPEWQPRHPCQPLQDFAAGRSRCWPTPCSAPWNLLRRPLAGCPHVDSSKRNPTYIQPWWLMLLQKRHPLHLAWLVLDRPLVTKTKRAFFWRHEARRNVSRDPFGGVRE